VSGVFLLDWAAQAVSLFNASLLLWLGLTIALNAERPQPRQAGQRAAWRLGKYADGGQPAGGQPVLRQPFGAAHL
jgi:hypothetical protein